MKKKYIIITFMISFIVFSSLTLINLNLYKKEHSLYLQYYDNLYAYEYYKYDYQVKNPSYDQVEEMESLDFIDSLLPVYREKVNLNHKSSAKETYGIFTNKESLEIMGINKDLLLEGEYKTLQNNEVFIDETFANKHKVKIGDTVSLGYFGSKSKEYIVKGILKDHLSVGSGYVYFITDEETHNEFLNANSKLQYAFMFLKAKDYFSLKDYLKNYIPMAEAPQREDFQYEITYQIELDEFLNKDHRNAINILQDVIDIQSNKYSTYLDQANKLKQTISINIIIHTIILIVAITSIPYAYLKNYEKTINIPTEKIFVLKNRVISLLIGLVIANIVMIFYSNGIRKIKFINNSFIFHLLLLNILLVIYSVVDTAYNLKYISNKNKETNEENNKNKKSNVTNNENDNNKNIEKINKTSTSLNNDENNKNER